MRTVCIVICLIAMFCGLTIQANEYLPSIPRFIEEVGERTMISGSSLAPHSAGLNITGKPLAFKGMGFHSPAALLVVSGGEPETVLACVPLERGTLFHLDFVNSIYLAPVRETFVYEPAKGVSIIRVESPSAGVFEYYGLIPDKAGVASVQRTVGDIRIRSHDYENHRLTVGNRSIRFKGLVADGEPLSIKVRTGEPCEVRSMKGLY